MFYFFIFLFIYIFIYIYIFYILCCFLGARVHHRPAQPWEALLHSLVMSGLEVLSFVTVAYVLRWRILQCKGRPALEARVRWLQAMALAEFLVHSVSDALALCVSLIYGVAMDPLVFDFWGPGAPRALVLTDVLLGFAIQAGAGAVADGVILGALVWGVGLARLPVAALRTGGGFWSAVLVLVTLLFMMTMLYFRVYYRAGCLACPVTWCSIRCVPAAVA